MKRTPLDDYLAEHFLDEPRFAAACGVSMEALGALLDAGLVPAPSYVVEEGTLRSAVFGELPATGAKPGRYHRPGHVAWLRRAQAMPDAAALKARFLDGLRAEAGFDETRLEEIWSAFMQGVYGLCVAEPGSEAAIARKEALQERLSMVRRRDAFTPAEAREALALLEAYAAACMPFSPIDYPLSSRRHLVDELRPRLEACL